MTLTEFAKHCVIKTPQGDVKFNEAQLAEIKMIQDARDAGMELFMLKGRGFGGRIIMMAVADHAKKHGS